MRAIGLTNLARAIEHHPPKVYPHGCSFAVIAGGNLEASLLLLHSLWDRQLRELVNAVELAAAVPARLRRREQPHRARRAPRDDPSRLPLGDHLLVDRILVRRSSTWSELTT